MPSRSWPVRRSLGVGWMPLLVRQQFFDVLCIAFGKCAGFTKLAALFGSLCPSVVATVRTCTLKFACTVFAKTLFRS